MPRIKFDVWVSGLAPGGLDAEMGLQQEAQLAGGELSLGAWGTLMQRHQTGGWKYSSAAQGRLRLQVNLRKPYFCFTKIKY